MRVLLALLALIAGLLAPGMTVASATPVAGTEQVDAGTFMAGVAVAAASSLISRAGTTGAPGRATSRPAQVASLFAPQAIVLSDRPRE